MKLRNCLKQLQSAEYSGPKVCYLVQFEAQTLPRKTACDQSHGLLFVIAGAFPGLSGSRYQEVQLFSQLCR